MRATLLSLHSGRIAPFGAEGEPSAIAKRPVAGPVAIDYTGLVGDQQADRHHHGGPDKALHHYPLDHYAAWRAELPERATRFAGPGGFGEKISSLGLTEVAVCLGDVYRLGSAVVQVSQGRQPCWKLNRRFDVPDMVARVRASGRTGWYYRVLAPGEVQAGAAIELLERPHPDWPLAVLWRVLYGEPADAGALAALCRLDSLSTSWRDKAAARLNGFDQRT
ncbi:MAG: MOSC domain-containing protein [Thiobacillus sp.]|nr:MOSC domain-containing protein [Thiobacillus sp.]